MNLNQYSSKHFRDVFFGGNWTCSNIKDQLADVSWQEATQQVGELNSIAVLTYHIHYFVRVALRVLQGGLLEGNDKLSFDCPAISNQQDWEQMQLQLLKDAEAFADLVSQMPEEQFWQAFTDEKYGNYYRNIAGITEHTHYHLGQIVLIKKLLRG